MRLVALELLAYGPFRGTTLDFSAPGLHVVLGRNEAGKSTTLRAITGLLYGIDAKTADAHLHKMADLRIGGVLESGAGRRVRLVRRKGNANTLLDEQGAPVDDGVMQRLRVGVSRESFVHAFGLTHEALAAGAQALLEGKGDLGESLFDASLGGGGQVQRLVAELRAEADRIFKPRGTTLPLNEALKGFADAQRAVRERESRPEAFVEQEKGLRDATAERDARQRTRAELVARRARLERARRRLPLERRRERATERLATLGLSAEHVERVGALRERFAAYRHAVEERGRDAVEAERLGELVGQARRRAGLTGEDAAIVRVDPRTEARINARLRERTKLAGAIELAAADIARLERELARLASPAEAPTSPTPALGVLAGALERARNLGDVEVRVATRRAQLERRRADLAARAASDAPGATLEEFVALRMPALASVERLESRFDELSQAAARIDERVAELGVTASLIERQIAAQTGDFAPPDVSALHAARSARDEALRALRGAGEAERRALELDVERLLREADAVADRMLREADRVTALARLRSEAETNERQRERHGADRARAVEERAAVLGELAVLLEERAIPAPPGGGFAEVRALIDRHAKVTEAFGALREAEGELASDEQRASAVREELAAAAAAAGLTAEPGLRLAELIAASASGLSAIESALRAADESARARVKLRAELDERLAARERDEAALADVTRRLAELVTPLGVEVDASAEEVTRALELVRELFGHVDRRADVDARVRACDVSIGEFERDLARAVAELAPDLASTDPRDAAPMLFARAAEAHEAMQDLARTGAELEADGDAVVDDADRALVADPDAAERALRDLGDRIEEEDDAIARVVESIGGLRLGLESMRADSNAAEASTTAQLHLARVREHAERWSRVRLAEHVLSREIERYRQENQAPLLAASSELFARLTLGSFSGVKAGFDDRDRACLRCVRADGATEVDMAGLSDGTRDQLYLSLRLASLLRRAEALEPLPLVLDDVLIQLDDERAAAALRVLAEVSRTMQVLFFTHHARLVELARASVPAAELSVHELAPPAAADAQAVAGAG